MEDKKKVPKVDKSWLNPRWTTVQGADRGPIDAFGAIQEPDAETLVRCYQDTVYSCTKWMSDTVSSVPLRLYVKTMPHQKRPKCLTAKRKAPTLDHQIGNMEVEEVLDHHVLDVIEHPNEQMDKSEMLRVIDIDLSLTGNAYLYKRREVYELKEGQDVNEGIVTGLYPIPSQHMEMAVDVSGRFIGFNDRRYTTPKFVPKEDVVWFKFTDPRNPYGPGYSPVLGVYMRVLISQQEQAYLSSLFRNQARPDSMVSIKDITPSEAERVQKEMNQRFRQGGIGGIWVGNGEDMSVQPLSWNPKDMLGVDLYRWTKLQILNAFGLNPAIFDTESSNRAVADTARYMAMLNGVLPRCRLIEAKLNHSLLAEFDDRLFVLFDNPVPEDKEFILKEQDDLLDRNVLDVDEVRADRGLPARPDAQVESPVTNDLRSTVGGLTAIQSLQVSYYSGQLPREACTANVMLLFGFRKEEAESLFVPTKPHPLTEPQEEPNGDK